MNKKRSSRLETLAFVASLVDSRKREVETDALKTLVFLRDARPTKFSLNIIKRYKRPKVPKVPKPVVSQIPPPLLLQSTIYETSPPTSDESSQERSWIPTTPPLFRVSPTPTPTPPPLPTNSIPTPIATPRSILVGSSTKPTEGAINKKPIIKKKKVTFSKGLTRDDDQCRQCGDKETGQWRKGPYGKRTLCNKCGLYYRKLVNDFKPKKANALLRYCKNKASFARSQSSQKSGTSRRIFGIFGRR